MKFKKSKNWEEDIGFAIYGPNHLKDGATRGQIRKKIAKNIGIDWREIPVEGVTKGLNRMVKKGWLK